MEETVLGRIAGLVPMYNFLFQMPLSELTVVVLGTSAIIGLGFSVGIRKLFKLDPTDQQADLAIDLMQVASSYIGILLAFAGVLAWQNYQSAETAVQVEAGTASQLYRDLRMFGPPMDRSREALRNYVTSITVDEWPLMREGKRSTVTEDNLIRLFGEVAAASPANERETAIYQEALSQLNELVTLRRDRISTSQAQLPPVLWVVAIVGSILTIAYASAFVSSRYASLMICGISLTIGLMFLFLLSLDDPFRGRGAISSGPLIQLSSIFDRVDRLDRAPPSALNRADQRQ